MTVYIYKKYGGNVLVSGITKLEFTLLRAVRMYTNRKGIAIISRSSIQILKQLIYKSRNEFDNSPTLIPIMAETVAFRGALTRMMWGGDQQDALVADGFDSVTVLNSTSETEQIRYLDCNPNFVGF